jgi:hypothetical protein
MILYNNIYYPLILFKLKAKTSREATLLTSLSATSTLSATTRKSSKEH